MFSPRLLTTTALSVTIALAALASAQDVNFNITIPNSLGVAVGDVSRNLATEPVAVEFPANTFGATSAFGDPYQAQTTAASKDFSFELRWINNKTVQRDADDANGNTAYSPAAIYAQVVPLGQASTDALTDRVAVAFTRSGADVCVTNPAANTLSGQMLTGPAFTIAEAGIWQTLATPNIGAVVDATAFAAAFTGIPANQVATLGRAGTHDSDLAVGVARLVGPARELQGHALAGTVPTADNIATYNTAAAAIRGAACGVSTNSGQQFSARVELGRWNTDTNAFVVANDVLLPAGTYQAQVQIRIVERTTWAIGTGAGNEATVP